MKCSRDVLIINLHISELSIRSKTRCPVTEEQRRILMEEDFVTSNVLKAVQGYAPKDEKRICKFGKQCRKRACRFEHVSFNKGKL